MLVDVTKIMTFTRHIGFFGSLGGEGSQYLGNLLLASLITYLSRKKLSVRYVDPSSKLPLLWEQNREQNLILC
jgi:hypothetical protein